MLAHEMREGKLGWRMHKRDICRAIEKLRDTRGFTTAAAAAERSRAGTMPRTRGHIYRIVSRVLEEAAAVPLFLYSLFSAETRAGCVYNAALATAEKSREWREKGPRTGEEETLNPPGTLDISALPQRSVYTLLKWVKGVVLAGSAYRMSDESVLKKEVTFCRIL